MIKNCQSCAHRAGGALVGFIGARCMLSGCSCTVERQYPDRCGLNFENWVERPPGLLTQLGRLLVKTGAPDGQ
jgi:hypothetical protein